MGKDTPSELWMLQDEGYSIEIQINEAEVDRSSIPILRDSFTSFLVSEISLLSRHCKDTLNDLLR
jgi:hypothetical protein